jgi:hypothetical protein
MGMFLVENGTLVKGIKDGKEWYPQNFVEKPLKETLVFDKAQLVIDPTGIGKHACKPGDITIGGSCAEAGYYGFSYEGWTILVAGSEVRYG